jgi:spore coat polysaccharide biosynthesis predicted glycosyltransferase SpsG/L-amino acid N-acyltransferase YncA
VIRADGGAGVGSGHLARGLALTQAWVDRGGEATLVSASPPLWWESRYRREGAEVLGPDGSAPEGDWAVVDGYALGRHAERAARDAAPHIMAVDDHGIAGDHEVDVLVDQNLGASAATYACTAPGADLLLGPRYAILRRDFRAAHNRPRPIPERARRMLVGLGGSPPAEVRALVDQALAEPALRGLQPDWLEGVDDVPAAMAVADVALSASGSTCWELCCTGLPAVLLAIADNQLPLAAAMATHGAATNAGPLTELAPAALAAAVAGLAANVVARTEMARRGRILVDGRGARRVVTRLRADLLTLRPVTAADGLLLWEWANDPVVRAAAFKGDPIPRATHDAWFATRLADPGTWMYLAFRDESPAVGQVRFEGDGDRVEIDVSVQSAARGRGWGAALIDAAVRRLFAESTVSTVVARIKEQNTGSRSTFDDADFTHEHTAGDGPSLSLRYARRRTVRG